MKRTLAAALLAIAAAAAPAQTLYKCGNVYSQAPCEYGAPPAKIKPDEAPKAPSAPHGRELCRAEVTSALAPYGVSGDPVERIAPPVPELLRFGEQAIEARRIDVYLQPRFYGVHASSRPYRCWVSVDEKRLLRLAGPDAY